MVKSPELLMALFDRGASPNAADREGNTLMHTTDSPELIPALLTHGGDPNVTNQVDQPPNRHFFFLCDCFALIPTLTRRFFHNL